MKVFAPGFSFGLVFCVCTWASLSKISFFSGCQAEWTEYQSNCYRYFNAPSTWTTALENCQAENGDLVDILDSGTNDFIRDISSSGGNQVWLGGFNPLGTPALGSWKWHRASEPWIYENWGSGQPSGDGNYLSMALWSSDILGYWNDADPSSYFQYVCKKPKGKV